MKDAVIMENWRQIWNNRELDMEKLLSNDIRERFMELKRLTGNDTMGKNGVSYENFMKQYRHMAEDLAGINGEKPKSVFEVGCGSGPYLMMYEHDGLEIGGMDYAQTLIDAARAVLKEPRELYCGEAVNLKTEIKYDAVFSTSAFEYFENDAYAIKVLDLMLDKARYSIGILDAHDAALEEEYLAYRRAAMENYDERYKGLAKKFYSREFFENYAKARGLKVIFKKSYLDGYWNQPFVFDAYMYKAEGTDSL